MAFLTAPLRHEIETVARAVALDLLDLRT